MNQAVQEVAVFGGGCFWCTEAVFLDVEGVLAVESGYAGGHTRNPGYREVCDGDTGHAEVVKVSFDPARIGYREMLEIFFATHDPTQLNRQGTDVGTQYRSVVFAESDAQREAALEVIATLEREHIFGAPIVTKVVLLDGNYWPAEEYHQNYFARNPEQGYCAAVIGAEAREIPPEVRASAEVEPRLSAARNGTAAPRSGCRRFFMARRWEARGGRFRPRRSAAARRPR